jgi:DNA modification methylase
MESERRRLMEFNLLCGDAIEQLHKLKDNSVNTCVTSPPYYGLRDYGIDGQLGLEETPEEYINRLVEVFREVKRVLRDDGILWINIGDSYAGGGKGRKANGEIASLDNSSITTYKAGGARGNLKKTIGAKPKDLIGIPWMLAFALRADGWYLRQDIIWAKNNPMPESVKDRCTRSHEYIFMLTKNKKYWFDHEAMQEPAVCSNDRRSGKGHIEYNGIRKDSGIQNSFVSISETRNKRDVWNVSVCSTVKEAHFAIFPKELIEPCILAGCPKDGWVLDPFSGSGTSGIVAVNNNRNYVGVELNPEYIEITKRRIEKECMNVFTVVKSQ